MKKIIYGIVALTLIASMVVGFGLVMKNLTNNEIHVTSHNDNGAVKEYVMTYNIYGEVIGEHIITRGMES